jgi:hypothetical protein
MNTHLPPTQIQKPFIIFGAKVDDTFVYIGVCATNSQKSTSAVQNRFPTAVFYTLETLTATLDIAARRSQHYRKYFGLPNTASQANLFVTPPVLQPLTINLPIAGQQQQPKKNGVKRKPARFISAYGPDDVNGEWNFALNRVQQ